MSDMRDPGEFDTAADGAPDEFAVGCLTVRGLRALPGSFNYSVGLGDERVMFLHESDGKRGFFWAGMYRLPAGKVKFAKDAEFYREMAGAFQLPGRRPFDPAILALPVPEGWAHEAFQTRDKYGKRRGIVHLYTGPAAAVILRYHTDGAAVADYPRFVQLNAGLAIDPDAWRTQEDYVDLAPPGPPATDRPMPAEVRAEIAAAIDRARTLLKLRPSASPAATVKAISAHVDQVLATRRPRAGQARDDLAIDLGCLWGQAVCDTLRWTWCVVTDGERETFAIASGNRAHAIAPMVYLQRQLAQPAASADNTTELLYNMLMAGDLPRSKPGALKWLG